MVKSIKGKIEWDEQLAMVDHHDFYHTYDYHHLSKNNDELPILIKYTDYKTTLILPLLIRAIENSDFKDATSVYGYAGLLALNIDEQFKKENFYNELNAFFNENKIISVFSRLHPFIEHQEKIHESLGKVIPYGKIVYKDLSDTLEVQRAKYNRRLKTYLNKSRKLCTVIEGKIDKHLDTFIHLYIENMKRVNANDSYFFDADYFYKLLSSKDINSELLLCKLDETQEIIAGAIFIKTGDMVQYHLSGLSEDYFKLNPIKLIIDEVRIRSTMEGFKYLNLGGGRGSKEDTLYKFKSSFSKDFKVFKLWKYIIDEDAYRMLSEKHLGKPLEDDDLYLGYFPAYRTQIEICTKKIN